VKQNSRAFVPEINDKLEFLLTEHWRYKGAEGGRGAGKSVSFADAVLARMLQSPITVTAGREHDNTIRDSIHKLLKERVQYHRLDKIIDVSDHGLKCINGSELNYIHFHNNINGIRGLQGTMICWVFEAQTMSKESWDELYPTIRLPGSEIWLEWNPDQDDDFVMSIFAHPEDGRSKLVHIDYLENPLCPQVLLDEANKCKELAERTGDWEDYNHIWLGHPSKIGHRIYPMFTKERHIAYGVQLDDPATFNESMFFMGQDPATKYYPFCVWIKRIHKGEKRFKYIVYNEYPTLQSMNGKYFYEIRNEKVCTISLKQRAAIFKVLDNTIDKTYNDVEVKHRAVDTRFAKASGAASTTLGRTKGLIETWVGPENGGMTFQTPPEHIIDVQREVLQGLMTYDEALGYIPGYNEPEFYVMPHCHNVIWSLLHHRVNNETKSEDPKYKDPIDALRITFALMKGVAHVRKEVQTETPQIERELFGIDKANALREHWEKRSIYT